MGRFTMVTVRFLRDTALPRFTMRKGQEWRIRAERLTFEGFALGGGFVEWDRYEVVE
tara:strand:+ start:505 stop:675 length:171 start_codon:yes stop_codon:yes gene_type:complete